MNVTAGIKHQLIERMENLLTEHKIPRIKEIGSYFVELLDNSDKAIISVKFLEELISHNKYKKEDIVDYSIGFMILIGYSYMHELNKVTEFAKELLKHSPSAERYKITMLALTTELSPLQDLEFRMKAVKEQFAPDKYSTRSNFSD